MIIIGNKPYYTIKLNNIIDTFDENIRCNFSLPNNNNGTKPYMQFLNCHVYHNITNNNCLKCYIKNTNSDEQYILNFIKCFDKNNYKKIYNQNNSNRIVYNQYLKNMNCPYQFNKLPRLGCNAIFDILLKNKKLVYISHFSLAHVNHIEHIEHLYNIKRKPSSCHNINDEINIIKWLHNHNKIDATLCMLKDVTLPTFDCSQIKPSIYITHLLLKEYGICILENFFEDTDIINFIKEFEFIFNNHKDSIDILDKEECNFIKDKFYNNPFLNEIALKYNKNLNKNTLLLNKLVYEDGIVKNSDNGWQRDNHTCQFKTLMYLSDVTHENGNFQFLTNSNTEQIGFHKTITPETIKNNQNIELHDIVGNKGTIVLVDTTYIHRDNIIKNGERIAMTQYI